MKRRQAGFTLTEMMVVVSIIGVLVTMAIVYMRGNVRPIDVANRFGDLVREGSRRAVALGPVRSDVVVGLGTKARTQITATAVTAGTPAVTTVTFTLWRLQENVLPSNSGTWIPIEQYKTDSKVTVESWSPGVVDHTAGSRTTSWAAWSATPPPIQCRPDGTCDSCTVFFQSAIPGPTCDPTLPAVQGQFEQCAKVAVLRLGGAINTRTDWN